MQWMKLLREPLVHFLLLGAALFVVFGIVGKRRDREPDNIVVTRGQIEHLEAGFTRTWHRPPTPEELEGLIQEYVREEVYAREAMALGLDRDDTIIRRRLRQKMEFLSEDLIDQGAPSDEELQAYLAANGEPFRVPSRYSFSQVYLNPDRHGERLAAEADDLLAALKRLGNRVDPAAMGDPFMLEHSFDATPANLIARLFGGDFVRALEEITPGTWHGPVQSGYGWHFVLVTERTEGRIPALEEVRDAVLREWDNTRRLEANEAFYQELLKRYRVTVEEPDSATQKARLAGG